MQHELLIDGSRFCDYQGFVAEFNRAYLAVFGGSPWDGDDLNDFDDFVEAAGQRLTIRWINSQKSISDLGHAEMADYWSKAMASIPGWALAAASHQHMVRRHQEMIDQAAAGQGRTLFEWLVFQIRSNEHVDLKLE